MFAQVIDDRDGRTLTAAGTLDKEVRQQLAYGGNKAAAGVVGKLIAQRALAAGIKQVAFDRREYKYHGRIAAMADAARDAGLDIGAKPEVVEPEPAPEPKKKKPAAKQPKKPAASKAPEESQAPETQS